MPAIKAKHKRWAIEYIKPIALEADPNAAWGVWHWYKTPEERDAALKKLQQRENTPGWGMGFLWRSHDVARTEQGKKIYPKKRTVPTEQQERKL